MSSPPPRPIGRKLIVGLTGGIGAGKSSVADRLRERGAAIIDADRTGHETLKQQEAKAELTAKFGQTILGSDLEIDRAKLAQVVFNDPAKRAELEAIVHPRMMEQMQRAVSQALDDPRVPLVVLDAAILLEKGWDGICDRILFVDVPRETRLARLMTHRGWSAEELDRREQAQWPVEKKKARADFVIDNGASPEQCRSQVDRIYNELVSAS